MLRLYSDHLPILISIDRPWSKGRLSSLFTEINENDFIVLLIPTNTTGERFSLLCTEFFDRTNPEPVEICRHFPPEYEVESLPSYTIVSGLPTYDDALEEFRKAGIILTPPMPVVKIFEKDPAAVGSTAKENQIFNMENGVNTDTDNISVTSTCTCGAANNSNLTNPNSVYTVPSPLASQVIELSPEQLAALSQKRLSLQITFNNAVRRNSRPRGVDLYRQVNRNNLLRSQAAAAAAATREGFPQIHRSSSTLTLSNEPNMLDRRLMQHLQHRGSLY
ncbi:unnamed protein product [Ceratitis capitata]|uniref:(Mediterranean fruit fly) hypothetical protein n=1 Tax=Ceratitis capitata TaxID=7213 RepID=A0A811V9R5_CERCA|nr:unnamed protein product [Ceratitis capitata]